MTDQPPKDAKQANDDIETVMRKLRSADAYLARTPETAKPYKAEALNREIAACLSAVRLLAARATDQVLAGNLVQTAEQVAKDIRNSFSS